MVRGLYGSWLVAVLALLCTSCTDLLLARYRDDAYLAQHTYRLGERFLNVGDVTLCYQELGQGEPVIILPGLGTSVDFWQLNVPALADYFRVLAVDLPGFGKSDKPDASYDLLWLSRQVLAFMDAKQIERAHFIGGSMGGHLGLLLALHHPDRVGKLVIMGSSGMWPHPGVLLDLALKTLWNEWLVTDHLRRAWPDIYWKLSKRQPPIMHNLFRYQMAVRADARRYAPEGRAAARALRSIFYRTCRDELDKIDTPVLLIWGEGDHIHPIKDAEFFAEHLPDAKLVVVPDAGHEVMIDNPPLFNSLVREFLARESDGSESPVERPGCTARQHLAHDRSRNAVQDGTLQNCHDLVSVASPPGG